MGYTAKASSISTGTTKVSDSLLVIDGYNLTGLWSGPAFTKQSEDLLKIKEKLEKEIQKCVSYASSLETLQRYKNNKNTITGLYSSLYSLPSDEEYDDDRKIYNRKIAILENENQQLRESLLANMAAFSASKIGAELSLVSYDVNPLPHEYNEIPLMFQTDYPDIPFSQGSVATSGCGISCAAMVISYYSESEVTPGDLGKLYNDTSVSNARKMTNALDAYGISWENNWDAGYNFYEVKQKIEEEGYVAIMLMNENSHFTNYGHFILATGVTEDGKFMINDPNSANYNRGNLQDGFENGFSDGMIQKGWSGCWLIEPKDAYMLKQLSGETEQTEQEE